jgi:hypothetical protein
MRITYSDPAIVALVMPCSASNSAVLNPLAIAAAEGRKFGSFL